MFWSIQILYTIPLAAFYFQVIKMLSFDIKQIMLKGITDFDDQNVY